MFYHVKYSLEFSSFSFPPHQNLYLCQSITNWEILTSAIRAFVKNPVKENFYGKRKNNN